MRWPTYGCRFCPFTQLQTPLIQGCCWKRHGCGAGWKKIQAISSPLYNVASVLDLQGKNQEALAVYQQALKLFPGDQRVLNRYGVALQDSGDAQQAQGIFQQVIAAHPDACDARFNLARLDLQGQLVKEAEQQFRLMLEQCPPQAAVESGLGVSLAVKGNTDAAKTEFRKALEIDPHDLTALYTLGNLALKENQLAEAMRLLEAATQAHPEDIDTHAVLAEAYAQSKRWNDATNQLRIAITIAPSNPALHTLLSQILAGSGQLQQAIQEQETAVRLEPNDADAWNSLGTENASAGHVAEARQAFNRALQLDPAHAQARANLEHLPHP